MGSPERVKGHVKRDIEDSSGGRDDEAWEADERRKRRSGKSKQPGSGEENEGGENNGRKEKSESRKRPGGASKAVSEEDDYESRKESRAKQMKKKQEESALESLSNWYQDGDGENRHDGGERSERRKSTSKLTGRESSQSRSKVKDERMHDVEPPEKDTRKEGRNPRKRWDDANIADKVEESKNYAEKYDKKAGHGEGDKNLKYHEKDEKRSETDDMSGKEKIDTAERSYNADEDSSTLKRDRGKKDIDRSTRSRTPERSTRRHHDSEYSEMDSDKSGSYRRKDLEKDSYRDERSRGRDDSWKRRQETKEGDAPYDYTRDWESPSQRRGRDRDRVDPERHMGRNRTYDVIEIETKAYDDYGRKNEVDEQSAIARNTDDQSVEGSKDRYGDDRNKDDIEGGIGRGQKGNLPSRPGGGWQGQSNNRMGRGGRVRPTGRDGQPVNMQVPMMGSPFGPLGMPPPGGMQPLTPAMSPGPGPPMSPAVFIPPFSPPVVWPGVVPPGGPSGPIFPPNIGTPQNPAMFFNQPGPVRGMPPNILGPGFNPLGPMGRGQQQDKGPGGWVPPRNNGPPGKAPSRGEQNDYSQNFVDTGMRPQNFIRELELTSVVEDYPKLRELIQKKDEIVANSASAPMYYKCDLREHVLSPEFFGTKFDVILVDPPWEEYVHRAPGVTDHMDYWTFEEIMNLKIEAIADTPCFVFLWVGDGVGLEQGRQCLKKWGFRRCEDICWVKTNKTTATPGLRHDSHTLFQRSKEHCLMGIKGTVRRSTDGHIIHANIDTDVIIAEEPPYGSTAKPEDMYRIIEHFSLGRRRLELFGEDHNIRAGWLTVGKDLSSSNFNSEGYIRNFADKDGKVWQGGGGRNPPPEAGHLVLTTPDIEALRPKSPMKNQLQMQQQSQQTNTISLTPGSGGGNKRPGGNDPLSHNGPGMNQEASSSNIPGPVPWGPPMGGVMGGPNEGFFDNMYGGYNGPFGPMGGEFMDFETQRAMNNMM
ncbi:putative mRNA (2'-O-methyladenosine-N(6)-)-methyltransferase [Helianthus annuus]|nr:putative mRNA (2'-O-methyladenosine-N(6)-)-methyltransferase [Helianthus annuus]KAJ0721779.1 putative mRNA (2'-O-methyladenosine-N(6)-)-methyltransferase [Helianthus annuus]KAJ0900915.1 putative mRNA (2'-O-methyladenosine-N(6)-)-methyltransferase [Helianthus annuus]